MNGRASIVRDEDLLEPLRGEAASCRRLAIGVEVEEASSTAPRPSGAPGSGSPGVARSLRSSPSMAYDALRPARGRPAPRSRSMCARARRATEAALLSRCTGSGSTSAARSPTWWPSTSAARVIDRQVRLDAAAIPPRGCWTASGCWPPSSAPTSAGLLAQTESHRARHDRRHQRAARAQGREGRAAHHRGPSRRHRDARGAEGRPLQPAHAAAGAARAARPPPRRARAHALRRHASRTPLERRSLRAALATLGRRASRRWRSAICIPTATPSRAATPAAPSRGGFPGVYVSLSSEVLPQIKEYERVWTTVVNAYVGPALARYLESLAARLASHGYRGDVLIMQSHGGVAPIARVDAAGGGRRAVGTGRRRRRGALRRAAPRRGDLITFDMGGTCTDIALLQGGEPQLTGREDGRRREGRAARRSTSTRSAPAAAPSRWVDAGGILHVGPESAGAEPGPACYGRVARARR